MPDVAVGVEELRIRDRSGVYRAFYFKRSRRGVLILHAFAKKTRKTPTYELDIARFRLKKKSRAVVTHSATELASALGLTPADAVEIEVRSTLNDKIIEIVAKHGLTHAQVAKIAETSRTRMTAILNRNTQDVSTDLLLRILARLGYRVKIRFSKAA